MTYDFQNCRTPASKLPTAWAEGRGGPSFYGRFIAVGGWSRAKRPPSMGAIVGRPQPPIRGRFVRAIFEVTILLVTTAATHCAAENTPIAQVADQIRVSPSLGATVPLDLSFVDADGRTARLGDSFGGRPVILHLVYYECPMLCKLSSDGLLRALSTLSLKPGRDFSIVTVSFDPREGPQMSARARHLASERIGREAVDAGWQFLTGERPAIDELCDAVGFRYVYDEKTGQFAHASGVFIVTPDGKLSRYLSGVEFSPRDLRLAVVEASAGKVGTAVDQVMLMCYMYDPITGKYGFAIMSGLRAAGVLTVGAMALGIFLMIRRERRSGFQPDKTTAMSG